MEKGLINSIEFLMYSYFELDFGSEKEEVIQNSIYKAYTDATNRGAYNTLLLSEDKEKSKAEKVNGIALIKEFINEIDGNNYEALHKYYCTELTNAYSDIRDANKNQCFTYGNAQKWLNMTTKYLYLLSYLYQQFNPESDYYKKYGEKFISLKEKLNIPIDSFILQKVWDDIADVDVPLREGKKRVNKYSSEKVIPWSKWDDKTYDVFYGELSESDKINEPLIDWEGPAWIEISKKRKGK